MSSYITWSTRVLPALLLMGTLTYAAPLFKNSVVSNDIDFIHTDDPAVAFDLLVAGRETKEMPDKRNDDLMQKGVFVFNLQFRDGPKISIWAAAAFGDIETASRSVDPVCAALSKLPLGLRAKLSHVVIHQGDEVAFADELGHFFVLYSVNIEKRLATHDLEETIFHETIHATLEKDHASHPEWIAAQKKDSDFITDYAAKLPVKEDLPESALFAYTLIHYPGRMPAEVERSVEQTMPHRLQYLKLLFEQLRRPAK